LLRGTEVTSSGTFGDGDTYQEAYKAARKSWEKSYKGLTEPVYMRVYKEGKKVEERGLTDGEKADCH
jgi:hypothetical protein